MIDVSKLTAEQLDDAQAIFSKERGISSSPGANCLREAALYLQVPWDKPTEEEVDKAVEVYNRVDGAQHVSIRWCLRNFIDHRNAALLPQPEDPRVDKLAYRFRAELQMSCDNQRTTSIEFVLAEIAVKELLG